MLLTPKGLKACEDLCAFEKFIRDYSLLAQREAYEAAVWDDYLVAATACGYGEIALKQMQHLIPEYQFASECYDSGMDTFDLLRMSHAHSIITSSLAKERSSSGSNSFGGGGGSSSFGGGGGFSGGSSGGGAR